MQSRPGATMRWKDAPPLVVALVIAAAVKIALLWADVFPFNSDEAVVALMARHILQGERPLFFYGQAYLGSLDAWLIAGMMLLVGQRVLAVRLVQSFLYLGTVATTYWLGRRVFRSRWVASAAALWLAVPPVLVTLYTTVTLGGYGEVLLIGNVLILWSLRLGAPPPAPPHRKTAGGEGRQGWGAKSPSPQRLRDLNAIGVLLCRCGEGRGGVEWLGFGLLAGFGFWGFGLLGAYILPCVLWLAWRDLRGLKDLGGLFMRWAGALLGFVAGSAPWWSYTLRSGPATLTELGGAHVAGAAGGVGLHLLNAVLFNLPALLGLRPPWDVRLLALPLAPLALVVFMLTLGNSLARLRGATASDPARAGRVLLLGVALTTIVAFVLTPFGGDPSGRYFLPMAVPLALFMGELLLRVRRNLPRLSTVMLGGVLLFNLWGNVQSALANPPGITTQFDPVAQVDRRYDPDLIAFLQAHGETRGYGNYWVEFPIAFLSGEQLIYSARLPYHQDFAYTPRDDRYAPYARAVADADRVAYITTNHPALDAHIGSGLRGLDVSFQEAQIGDYHVFYALSRVVRPADLDLGAANAGRSRQGQDE